MRMRQQWTMLLTIAAALLVAAAVIPAPCSATALLQRMARQALEEDRWGPWSEEWSVCSRSCGGGVSYQERKCITSREGARPNCVGPNLNYGSCNIQDCPEGAKDFREEQCSRFDTESFRGDYHTWVPYLGADDKCELNCMPKGKHFYYRLAETVIDGTRCEAEKLDICVNGECMKVGCDNMLGSNAKEDICRECNGNGSSCKTITGVFKRRKLPFGYNDILVIPAGAVNIYIDEVKASNNYLALRSATGHYYINGNFSIDFPQPFKVADTVVYYDRKFDQPFYGAEVFHALGPISEPLFVVLITQERNYGIAYNYSVPLDNEGAEPDTYSWLFGKFAPCTRTCGGGYQLRDVWCARSSDYERVPEYLCDPLLKPAVNHSCNMESCPPSWFAGEWSLCSTTCGEGQQVRLVYCEQILQGDQPEIIHDSICENGTILDKPDYKQDCVLAPCPEWRTGDWSQCSVTCGRGMQTRSVSCLSNEILSDAHCPADSRPEDQDECHMGPCENVQWLVSQWSDCSERCGDGIQTRQVHCAGPSGIIYSDDVCQSNLRPDLIQRCSSRQACLPMWYASRWTECSTDCGNGLRIRNVFCAQLVNGEWETTSDDMCNATIKLHTSEICNNEPCVGATWLTGPWSKCSAECGGGTRTRQIMCFEGQDSSVSLQCDQLTRPLELESCNNQTCTDSPDCHASLFGCCLDGITRRTGPNNEGCDTSPTDSPTARPTEPPTARPTARATHSPTEPPTDPPTAAPTTQSPSTSTPSCNDSEFGCCGNSTTAATGPDGQGCPQEPSLETCEMPESPGPCSTYVLKWYFDITTQRCFNFWYGGCDGNSNRFETEKECRSACAPQREVMTQEEMCSLPMEVGPCKASIPRYYYNTETGRCERFDYGGCHGNMNKFSSYQACENHCGSMSEDPCSMHQDSGNCYEYQLRWFYDVRTQQCEQFNYTGCLGNPNRFDDVESCKERCGVVDREPETPDIVGAVVDVCGLPQEAGPCGDSILQWFYSIELNACQEFVYGGCNGNGNNFDTETDCSQACVSLGAVTKCHRSRKYAEYLSQGSIGSFIPQCTLEGEFEPMQCHGSTGHCWCVDTDGLEISGSRRAPGHHVQRPNCEAYRPQVLSICQRHLKQVQGKDGVSPPGTYVPQCTETGKYETIQCYGSTGYCWCVNINGEEIDGTRRGPGTGEPNCDGGPQGPCPILVSHIESGSASSEFQPVCTPDGLFSRVQCEGATQCLCVNETTGDVLKVLNEAPQDGDIDACNDAHEELTRCQEHRNSVLAVEEPEGHIRFVPECTEAGEYRQVQCYGSTGHCWCVSDIGEEIKNTRRRPGEGLPECTEFRPELTTNSPRGTSPSFDTSPRSGGSTPAVSSATSTTPTVSATPEGQSATTSALSTALSTSSTTLSRASTDLSADSTDGVPSTPSASSSTIAASSTTPASTPTESSTSSATPSPAPATTSRPSPASTSKTLPSATQETVTVTGTMCWIRRQEALANTLRGVFVPQCEADGSFVAKQCYDLIGVCWCVHEDGTEQGGTRVGINEHLDCHDICSMPEFRGQCPSNIQKWFFNAEAGVCETFTYSGCQGNKNQFKDRESCEQRCFVPDPTTCPEKRDMALASGALGVFVPECTEDGRYMPQQCHGSIGHCWCVDEEGMELGATRRGPGEELLDCEDVCSLPKYSGPCKGSSTMWYYDVMDKQCQSFSYGGCQGNGNRFETQAECEQTCHIPVFTGRPATTCETQREEALDSGRLDVFVPQCTEEGAFEARQCYDLIGQCWCVNDDGESQGGTRTREGQIPLDCNDKCSFPKFTGPCRADIPKWYYSRETMSCEEFVYGGCNGNMNQFDSREECQQACVPQGHGMQSCHAQREEALNSIQPGSYVPQCTDDGWFTSRQCYESTGQCWCVTESGMEQGDTRREAAMPQLDCDDVCSFPKSSGPCLGYFAMWFFNTEEQECQRFIFGGCQGNGNRFDSREECLQTCMVPEPTSPEPQSLCVVTRKDAMGQDVVGNFVPQCTEEGLFTRMQCHGSTGYCWCVDEITGEEMVGSVGLQRGDRPDCDAFYQGNQVTEVDQDNITAPGNEPANVPHHPQGDEGCATSTFGCCPDGVTQASTEDRSGCPGVTPPMLEVAPSDATVVLGSTLTITCQAQGNPLPTVTWYRNDALIEDLGDSRISVQEDGTLVIEDVIETDSGAYVCRASNGVGQAAKVAVDVNVFTPVQIPETSQHSVRAKEGDVVELYCHATGNPKPVVTWQIGTSLLPGDDPRMTQLEDDTLRIENVDLGDAGNYICTGRNMFGVVQKRTVTVTIEAEVHIVTVPEDTTADVGSSIRLSCASTGSPKPTTRWTVNNVGLPAMDRFEFLPTGDLIINDVRSTDAGTYTCSAANGITSQKASATVTVTGAGNVDPNCKDNNNYANCRVVLRANFCHRSPYDVYCCATCRDNPVRGQRRRRRR